MKTKLLVLFFLVVVLMFAGCNKIDDPSNTEQSSTAQTSSSEQSSITQPSTSSVAQTSIDYSIFEGPESAYKAFLSNLYSRDEDPRILYDRKDWDYCDRHSDTMEFYFALKDLDNDGTPELLVDVNWGNVAVYTFNDGLIKVGNRNYLAGTFRMFFSDNPAYPGIFYFSVGGGLERYGYMTVKDNEFISEELWNEDYSGWRENRIEELSKDKGLIKESKNVYSKGNDIEWIAVEP